MNPKVHLRRALRDAGRAYQNGLIDLEAVDATRRRVDQIRKRWRALQRRLRRHRKHVVSLNHLARVRAEIARGGVIIAYDCEYVSAGPARQLGIAIWSAGRITTRSYTTPTYDKPTATPCRFGPDRIVSSRFLVGLAQRLYRTPGIHVFHSGDAEVSKLALDARNPGHIDTASITHGLFVTGESPSLARLCDHLGLDATGAHNAGNDARFTLDVLIAIATRMETAR